MISSNSRSLSTIQDRSRAGFIHNLILGVVEISFLLLLEEEDAEVRHERCKLFGDILQGFRLFFERIEQVRLDL